MEGEEKKPLKPINRIDHAIFNVYKVISYVSAVALVAVAVICTANAFTSSVLKFGITNSTELVTYLNIPVVFLSLAFIQLERGHTSIDLLVGHFPAIVQRVLATLGYLIGIAISAFIGYRSVVLTINKYNLSEKASAARNSFVIWPFAAVVALGFLLLAVAMVWWIIREWTIPKEEQAGYTPPPAPASFDDEQEGEV